MSLQRVTVLYMTCSKILTKSRNEQTEFLNVPSLEIQINTLTSHGKSNLFSLVSEMALPLHVTRARKRIYSSYANCI
jgi:hypothetical protein